MGFIKALFGKGNKKEEKKEKEKKFMNRFSQDTSRRSVQFRDQPIIREFPRGPRKSCPGGEVADMVDKALAQEVRRRVSVRVNRRDDSPHHLLASQSALNRRHSTVHSRAAESDDDSVYYAFGKFEKREEEKMKTKCAELEKTVEKERIEREEERRRNNQTIDLLHRNFVELENRMKRMEMERLNSSFHHSHLGIASGQMQMANSYDPHALQMQRMMLQNYPMAGQTHMAPLMPHSTQFGLRPTPPPSEISSNHSTHSVRAGEALCESADATFTIQGPNY